MPIKNFTHMHKSRHCGFQCHLLSRFKSSRNRGTLSEKCPYSATSTPAHLFDKRRRQKEALEHFKHVIAIGPNRGHIFQNKLLNTLTAILKISALLRPEVSIFSV